VLVEVPPPAYQPHGWRDPDTGQLLEAPIAQVRAHASGARFLAMAAGTRGGKTKCAAAEFARRVWFDFQAGKGRTPMGWGKDRRPRLHYWVVSPTAALSAEPKRYLYESIPPELIEQPFDSENRMWLKGDILIETKTAEKPQNLVSVGLNGLWLDEAARIKADAWQGNLRGRVTDFRGWVLFSSTPLGRNWFYHDIVKRGVDGDDRDPEIDTVTWTTADNPWIDRAEIESARRTMPARYFAREFLASFDAFSGTIYEEFDEKVHVVDRLPSPRDFRRVLLAMDFGWTAPQVMLVIGDLGGRFVVIEELYQAGKTHFDNRQEELAGAIVVDVPRPTWVGEAKRMIAKWCGHQRSSQVVCDPAEPDRINDLVRSGVYAVPADNDITFGIRCVSTAMHPVQGRPSLVIARGCTNLLREIRNYVWATGRDGEPTEMPAKDQSDHALDALRYGVVELMRYQALSTGDEPPPNPDRAPPPWNRGGGRAVGF